MGKLFLLTIAFTFSLLVLLWGIYVFDEDYLWAVFVAYIPAILLGSGGVVAFGVTLIEHMIRRMKDALK